MPDEVVERRRDVVEPVVGKPGLDVSDYRVQRESIHWSARDNFGVMSSELGMNSSSRFMNTNRLAFQILFAKFR